jgi:hypothetical protein
MRSIVHCVLSVVGRAHTLVRPTTADHESSPCSGKRSIHPTKSCPMHIRRVSTHAQTNRTLNRHRNCPESGVFCQSNWDQIRLAGRALPLVQSLPKAPSIHRDVVFTLATRHRPVKVIQHSNFIRSQLPPRSQLDWPYLDMCPQHIFSSRRVLLGRRVIFRHAFNCKCC